MEKYKWNPVFNLVMEMKREYINKFNKSDDLVFDNWLSELNSPKYNNVFDCLQVNQREEFILIRYGLQDVQRGMWEEPDSIYRECRSVVIDLLHEELVLTPFRKFFNLDEVEENKIDVITDKFLNASIVEVTNKLDGSMQSARWYRDNVFMTGSMALSKEDSWRLEDGYKMLNDHYLKMLKENADCTFIFEYISLKDAHVVLYQKSDEGLHLIGIRNSTTGKQYPYSKVQEMAATYGVKVVEMENITLEQVLEGMKTVHSHEKEGWVLNLDGQYVKIKCDDYVNIHRLLDKVSSINVIIENVAEDRFDDLISKIPDKYKDRVLNIANLLFKYITDTKESIREYFNSAPKENRKEFMIWVESNVPQNIKHYVRNEYLCIEYNLLKNGKQGYKRMIDLGFDDKYSVLFASVEKEEVK